VVIDLFGKPVTGENRWFTVALLERATPEWLFFISPGEQMRGSFDNRDPEGISDIGLRKHSSPSLFSTLNSMSLPTPTRPYGRKEDDDFLKRALQALNPFSRSCFFR